MIWYPYEQLKTMKAPYEIVDANGVYLYTKDQKMIDSVSSWWSVIHGYKNPVINQAIISQVEKFSHVMLGGLTHEPARKLSEKLASWLPGDLDYCFFSDSGSVAVEVALKMALQYYMNRGDERRTMILALEHAYHGDTFKTMEAGDDEDYHFVLKAYGASPYVVHIPTEITALEQAFETYHDRLNCVLVEPLLQGAGGMRMYDVSFLKKARELCDRYGVLLIFDEVAGRADPPHPRLFRLAAGILADPLRRLLRLSGSCGRQRTAGTGRAGGGAGRSHVGRGAERYDPGIRQWRASAMLSVPVPPLWKAPGLDGF